MSKYIFIMHCRGHKEQKFTTKLTAKKPTKKKNEYYLIFSLCFIFAADSVVNFAFVFWFSVTSAVHIFIACLSYFMLIP